MTELAFISLKTMDGKPCGFVRLSGGFAEIRLLEPLAGQAAVLTDGGVFAGNAGSRIAFSGRVLAVALHRDGRLLCMGLSRGAAITPDRVRAQLMPELTPSPYHSKKEPQTAPVYQKPPQTAPMGGVGTATRPQTAVPAAAQSADSRPAHADREAREPAERTASTAALEPAKNGEREAADAPATAPVYQKPQQTETERRHADPEPKENPVSTIPPAPAMEPEEAAPAKTDLPQREKRGLPIGKTAAAGERSAAAAEQTAADTESFMALLRRADRAFAAVMHREPPAVPTAVQTGGMRRGARYEPDGEQRTAPAVQQSAQTIHPSERADADAERTNDFDGVARETLLRRAPDVGSPEQNKAGAIRQTVFDDAAPKPFLQRAPVTHPPQQTDAAGQSALGERPTPVQGTPILNGRRLHAETNDAAGDWYDEVERLLENEPPANRSEPIANPFPNIFPGAKFLSIQKPGVPAYLCGDWYSGRGPTGERMRITAVPGAYSPRPPTHLTGFTRYIRARTGGYWIRVEAWNEP